MIVTFVKTTGPDSEYIYWHYMYRSRDFFLVNLGPL